MYLVSSRYFSWALGQEVSRHCSFPSGLEMKPRKQGNRTYMEMPKAVTPGERGARTPMDQKTFYVSMYLGRLEAVSNQLSSTIVN